MLTLIDRSLVRSYLKAYAVCLVSFLSLYIVVDLFTNLDDFAHRGNGLTGVVGRIASYYGYRVAQIFDRLCEAIVLLAAMFTVAWVQRNNELLPLLSAGVSTRRVVLPVLGSAFAMLTLTVLNQELVIPRISRYLFQDRDDPNGAKEVDVMGGFEPNSIHIEGTKGYRPDKSIKPFYLTIPEAMAGSLLHLSAQEARYIPPGDGPHTGGWLLLGTQPAQLEHWDNPGVLDMIDPGKYFLHTREVNFDVATRNHNWFQYVSTLRLRNELQRPDSNRVAAMAVLFHMRLTRPILGMILVLLGLSVILRDQNRNFFISACLCLVLCAIFFVTCFACRSLGENDYLSPALAAWLPVLLFGPLGFVLFDAVHT